MARPILTPLDAEQRKLAETYWTDARKLLMKQINRMNIEPSLIGQLEVDHVAWDGLYRAVRQSGTSRNEGAVHGKFTTFLFYCLRFALIDELRRLAFRTPHRGEAIYPIEDLVGILGENDEAEQLVEAHDAVEQLLTDLPEPNREIMRTHYLHCNGGTIADLCSTVGISKKDAWQQIYKSKVILRNQDKLRRTGS